MTAQATGSKITAISLNLFNENHSRKSDEPFFFAVHLGAFKGIPNQPTDVWRRMSAWLLTFTRTGKLFGNCQFKCVLGIARIMHGII